MYKKGGSKIVFESPFCMLLNYFLNPKAVYKRIRGQQIGLWVNSMRKD